MQEEIYMDNYRIRGKKYKAFKEYIIEQPKKKWFSSGIIWEPLAEYTPCGAWPLHTFRTKEAAQEYVDRLVFESMKYERVV